MEMVGSEKGLATSHHQQNDASGGFVGLIRTLWKESIASVFGGIGRRIFHRPLQVLLMSVSIATICGLGLGWMDSHRYTARMLHLYDVDGNPARLAQARIENAFREKMPQEATVYITPANRAGDLLDKSTLLTLLNLFEIIQDNMTGAPEQFRSKSVCYRPGGVRGVCDAIAIVDYWGKAPRQSIGKDQNIRDTITRRALAPNFEDTLGRRLEPGSVMGAIKRDASGEITAVKAARMRFRIQNNPNISSIFPTNIDGRNPLADTWQASLIHFIRKSRSAMIHAQVLTDLDTQLFIPVISPFDILLTAIGIGSAVIYSFMMLTGRHACTTSAWLVFANLAVVALASVCMISISVLAKFYAAPAILMSILFLFGMGTASSFFVVSAVFASSPPAASGMAETQQAIENAMVAGLSFLGRASLASFLGASAVLATAGAISDLRFVHKALLQSLIGLGFLFLFEWSFFVASLAISMRGGFRFVIPQMRFLLHKDARETNGGPPPVTHESRSDEDKVMRSRLPEALVHPITFLGMLVVTIGLFTLGVIGSARSRIAFNPDDLVASDEYLRAPIHTRDTYFPEGYTPVPFEVVVKFSIPNPWLASSNRHVLNTTQMLSHQLKLNKHVSSVDSWYDAFLHWMPEIGKASVPVFFERLEAFLSTEKGSQYRKDVLYFTSRETMPFMQVVRITGTLHYPHNANAKLAAMHAVKQLVSSSMNSNEERIVWSPEFASWEGLATTKTQTPILLACAATTAFLALAVILFNVAGSFLILGVTAAITVEVVGFLFALGRSVNPTTITVLILGIALSLHSNTFTFVACLTTHTPFRIDRLQAAWSHAGGAIIHSSITFFLAILPMVGARSLVLRTLFEMWAVNIALGLWHNLVALPLILSLFDFHPSRIADIDNDGKGEQSSGNGKGPNSAEDGLLRTFSLKFRPLPRIAPFVTIPEDAVLEGNQSVFTLE